MWDKRSIFGTVPQNAGRVVTLGEGGRQSPPTSFRGRELKKACGHSMALSVAGEWALWLNLSGLPDSEKRRIAGAPFEPGQAIFGPALTLMQQRCDVKEDKVCLPRRVTPHLLPLMRPPPAPSCEPPCPARHRGNAMAEIWPCSRRSLHLARKRPLSYVLHATGRECASRRRRTRPPIAQCASQSERAELDTDPNST
ncbi:hypothetical protein SKAU_G00062960 [Synaphobranchus kaupii]|uniref:Uncharacterized protein n=1 Tax=Synaphobranchus kaupii TaxID=118154 RepID=A0A9Q1G5R1_SYNKA|nr:hypothetical protein SKAU_G00062960 [Synaphobranchus kaupii]